MSNSIVSDLIAEWLEVCTHQILYANSIYPPSVFERCRKYALQVHRVRHPAVQQYICDQMECVSDWLRREQLDKFMVCIMRANDGHVLQRHVFEVRHDASAQASTLSSGALEEVVESFRVSLLKLRGSRLGGRPTRPSPGAL